ncbi:MAG: Rieske 2Fe-2S domain-containing protein [Pseudomonadota bacterium]
MSHDYQVVQWTPFKRRFDLWLLAGVFSYLIVFTLVSQLLAQQSEPANIVQTLIRALGTLAFILLTFVLCIGPLARLSDRFKPFLYNRRHLGVTLFSIGFLHAGLVVFWYHGFGDLNPFVSLLVSNPRYAAIAGFPFESLGLAALVILYVMAATSHDFWNANLGPGLWKALHMGVYLAYALLIAHVMLGALQSERSLVYLLAMGASAVVVCGLHLYTGWRDAIELTVDSDWIDVAAITEMIDGRARIVRPAAGEAIAVFRDGDSIAAVSNVCRHQAGPLGEGRIVDGCVTCPWHGFQYRLNDGCSPEPFTERIATYRTRIEAGRVFVNQVPAAPGTPQVPSIIEAN